MFRSRIPAFGMLFLLSVAGGASGYSYTYNASDFATEVVDYVQGQGVGNDWWPPNLPYNNPNRALGRPTIDTVGDGYIDPSETVPVVPVYPANRSYELVTIGTGGHLTLKFDHKVLDHPGNGYGVDFIVYGNPYQIIGNGVQWNNRDPNAPTLSSSIFGSDEGTVWVSQDNVTWYSVSPPPADVYPPTLGRMYDPVHPDASIGSWNHWWGQPTDPTKPVDPNWAPAHFAGKTLAQMCAGYRLSAGGTGFDIGQIEGLTPDPNTEPAWIQYVRITNPGTAQPPEIDALADVSPLPGDAQCDVDVDMKDFQALQVNYLRTDAAWDEGDFTGDGRVDMKDFMLLQVNFLVGAPAGGSSVPEPATMILLAAGAWLLRRRRA